MKKKYIATGIVIALALIGCGSPAPSENDKKNLDKQTKPYPIPTLSVYTPTPLPKVKAKPVDLLLTDGSWVVGKKDNYDAKTFTLGTYVIAASADGFNCYYEVVRNFEGNLQSVITNGNVNPGSSIRVTIKSNAKGLNLKGECLAKKSK